MLKKKTIKAFRKIEDEIKSSTIALVDEKTLKELFGRGLNSYDGISFFKTRIICLRQCGPMDRIKNVIWHEIAHILWPNKNHWFIECFAQKMHRYGDNAGRYSVRYNHCENDLPNRAKLLELAKKRVIEIEK